MKKREFIKNVNLGAAGLALVPSLLTGCNSPEEATENSKPLFGLEMVQIRPWRIG